MVAGDEIIGRSHAVATPRAAGESGDGAPIGWIAGDVRLLRGDAVGLLLTNEDGFVKCRESARDDSTQSP
jgi:hypothetical protein